jgi:hypothetical protein
VGERPVALVQHRYEWLYVYGFVEPKTGKTQWYLIPRANTQWLNLVYQAFAIDVGVSSEKIILVVEDNAAWHKSKKAIVPEGIHVEYLPLEKSKTNMDSLSVRSLVVSQSLQVTKAVHICQDLMNPPYSPELQPAERLWSLVDEPLINEYFESIEEMEEVLTKRCCMLENMTEEIKNLTNYHWLTYA